MDPETRFTEEEMQKILARAARSQERAESSREGGETGFSLARLQEVAADVGISPGHVQAAAHEVLLHRQESSSSLVGLPRELKAARLAPGTISDAQWERMVTEFRRIFKQNGIPSQFGEVREWVSSSATGESIPVVVRVAPSGEGTRIDVHQNVAAVPSLVLGLGGGFSLVGVLFAFLVALRVLQPDALIFALVMTMVGVAASVGGWFVAHSWSDRQRARLELAGDRAELIARS